MPDIFHYLPIEAPAQRVFETVSTPAGLDAWWAKRSSGRAVEGAEYELWFGPSYDWRAVVYRCIPGAEFGLEMTSADEDWRGTRLHFAVHGQDDLTHVRFQHLGWRRDNEHYRVSNYCWAMYLRLLKRYVERGEIVPYEVRLDA